MGWINGSMILYKSLLLFPFKCAFLKGCPSILNLALQLYLWYAYTKFCLHRFNNFQKAKDLKYKDELLKLLQSLEKALTWDQPNSESKTFEKPDTIFLQSESTGISSDYDWKRHQMLQPLWPVKCLKDAWKIAKVDNGSQFPIILLI